MPCFETFPHIKHLTACSTCSKPTQIFYHVKKAQAGPSALLQADAFCSFAEMCPLWMKIMSHTTTRWPLTFSRRSLASQPSCLPMTLPVARRLISCLWCSISLRSTMLSVRLPNQQVHAYSALAQHLICGFGVNVISLKTSSAMNLH